MSNFNHWFKYQVSEWDTCSRFLDPFAEGVMMRLCRSVWTSENGLPTDEKSLAEIARVPVEQFNAIWKSLLFGQFDCLILDGQERLVHPYLNSMKVVNKAKSDVYKESGSKGGKKSKVSRGLPGQTAANNGLPPSSVSGSVSVSGSSLSFKSFWGCGGLKRVGRGQAEKAYSAQVKTQADHDALVAGTLKAIAGLWKNTEPQHIPHPATWINSGDWRPDSQVDLDVPLKPSANGQPKSGAAATLFHSTNEADWLKG